LSVFDLALRARDAVVLLIDSDMRLCLADVPFLNTRNLSSATDLGHHLTPGSLLAYAQSVFVRDSMRR